MPSENTVDSRTLMRFGTLQMISCVETIDIEFVETKVLKAAPYSFLRIDPTSA